MFKVNQRITLEATDRARISHIAKARAGEVCVHTHENSTSIANRLSSNNNNNNSKVGSLQGA